MLSIDISIVYTTNNYYRYILIYVFIKSFFIMYFSPFLAHISCLIFLLKIILIVDEDNKLKENIYDDSQIVDGIRHEDLDQDEAKYSPEEKSVVDKSEIERTPTPSEESEEDEGSAILYIFLHSNFKFTIIN